MTRTQILTVHKLRRAARAREREWQEALEAEAHGKVGMLDLPVWARGVRVRKAGAFQWLVEATEWRGR